jgi:hypothetical protein
MGRFFPVYVCRSDGKLETISTHKRKESNQPTAEQLDSRPDASGTSDYYRPVRIDEPKHLDWRRKLGSMLARELGLADSGMSSTTATSIGPSRTDYRRQGLYIGRLSGKLQAL